MLATHSDTQLRIKGVVFQPDQAEPLVVHAAAGRLYPPVSLSERPTDDQRGRLVFISSESVESLADELSKAFAQKAAHLSIRML